MSVKSFSEQHNFLLDKMADISVFESKNWNFLKIAQHAFTYANNQDYSKLLNTRWHQPLWLLKLIFRIKRARNKGIGPAPNLAKFLFLEDGRFATDDQGVRHSLYFEKIIAHTPENERTIIQLRGEVDLSSDYAIKQVKASVGAAILDQNLTNMLAEAKIVVKRVQNLALAAEEKQYFASAMHVFIEEFAFYNTLFAGQKTKKCFFCTHYHREGLIAAAVANGIEIIELQHGLIAENDLYYVYPEYVTQATKHTLFPDKLLLFGEYWRQVLLRGSERKPEDCLAIGDYSYSTERPETEKENVIFIGAQKNMAQPYVDYVKSQLKRLETDYHDWRIKLKMHPLEKQVKLYQMIDHPQFELVGNDGDLHSLLAECRIQISIYSTTFFDSLGMNVVNLSLQNYTEYSDYARDMIKENVAFPLEIDQDPIVLYESIISSGKQLLSRDSVYAPFDGNAMKRVLK